MIAVHILRDRFVTRTLPQLGRAAEGRGASLGSGGPRNAQRLGGNATRRAWREPSLVAIRLAGDSRTVVGRRRQAARQARRSVPRQGERRRRIAAPPFLKTASRACCDPYPPPLFRRPRRQLYPPRAVPSACNPSLLTVLTLPAAMRFTLVSALALPVLAAAHGPAGIRHHARDGTTTSAAASGASSSSAAASGSSASSAASSAASGASSHSGSGSASAASSTGMGSITFTLSSVNPTAVPFSSITQNAPTQSTHAQATTYTAGSKPSDIPSAPPIPNCKCTYRLFVTQAQSFAQGHR